MADPPDIKCALAEQAWSFSKSTSVDENQSEESYSSVVERRELEAELRQLDRRNGHVDPTVEMKETWHNSDLVVADGMGNSMELPCMEEEVTMHRAIVMGSADLVGILPNSEELTCMHGNGKVEIPHYGGSALEKTCEKEEVSMQVVISKARPDSIEKYKETTMQKKGDVHGKELKESTFPCLQIGLSSTEMDLHISRKIAQPMNSTLTTNEEDSAYLDFLEAQRPKHSRPTALPTQTHLLLEHQAHSPDKHPHATTTKAITHPEPQPTAVSLVPNPKPDTPLPPCGPLSRSPHTSWAIIKPKIISQKPTRPKPKLVSNRPSPTYRVVSRRPRILSQPFSGVVLSGNFIR